MSRRSGGGAPSQRQLRVGEALRHALADILARADFRDPGLQNASITVTEVRISPDLANATVYVMPLAGADAPDVIAALRRAAPYLRGSVGRSVELRHVPQLSFALDRSFDYAERIDGLLRRPEVARDLAADSAPGPDDDRG